MGTLIYIHNCGGAYTGRSDGDCTGRYTLLPDYTRPKMSNGARHMIPAPCMYCCGMLCTPGGNVCYPKRNAFCHWNHKNDKYLYKHYTPPCTKEMLKNPDTTVTPPNTVGWEVLKDDSDHYVSRMPRSYGCVQNIRR